MCKLENIVEQLHSFRSEAKELIFNACLAALWARGFVVDESKELPADKRKLNYFSATDFNMLNYMQRHLRKIKN